MKEIYFNINVDKDNETQKSKLGKWNIRSLLLFCDTNVQQCLERILEF